MTDMTENAQDEISDYASSAEQRYAILEGVILQNKKKKMSMPQMNNPLVGQDQEQERAGYLQHASWLQDQIRDLLETGAKKRTPSFNNSHANQYYQYSQYVEGGSEIIPIDEQSRESSVEVTSRTNLSENLHEQEEIKGIEFLGQQFNRQGSKKRNEKPLESAMTSYELVLDVKFNKKKISQIQQPQCNIISAEEPMHEKNNLQGQNVCKTATNNTYTNTRVMDKTSLDSHMHKKQPSSGLLKNARSSPEQIQILHASQADTLAEEIKGQTVFQDNSSIENGENQDLNVKSKRSTSDRDLIALTPNMKISQQTSLAQLAKSAQESAKTTQTSSIGKHIQAQESSNIPEDNKPTISKTPTLKSCMKTNNHQQQQLKLQISQFAVTDQDHIIEGIAKPSRLFQKIIQNQISNLEESSTTSNSLSKGVSAARPCSPGGSILSLRGDSIHNKQASQQPARSQSFLKTNFGHLKVVSPKGFCSPHPQQMNPIPKNISPLTTITNQPNACIAPFNNILAQRMTKNINAVALSKKQSFSKQKQAKSDEEDENSGVSPPSAVASVAQGNFGMIASNNIRRISNFQSCIGGNKSEEDYESKNTVKRPSSLPKPSQESLVQSALLRQQLFRQPDASPHFADANKRPPSENQVTFTAQPEEERGTPQQRQNNKSPIVANQSISAIMPYQNLNLEKTIIKETLQRKALQRDNTTTTIKSSTSSNNRTHHNSQQFYKSPPTPKMFSLIQDCEHALLLSLSSQIKGTHTCSETTLSTSACGAGRQAKSFLFQTDIAERNREWLTQRRQQASSAKKPHSNLSHENIFSNPTTAATTVNAASPNQQADAYSNYFSPVNRNISLIANQQAIRQQNANFDRANLPKSPASYIFQLSKQKINESN